MGRGKEEVGVTEIMYRSAPSELWTEETEKEYDGLYNEALRAHGAKYPNDDGSYLDYVADYIRAHASPALSTVFADEDRIYEELKAERERAFREEGVILLNE